MKVYNETKTQELKEYDLTKGYLKEDKIIVKTHQAQKEVKEISHEEIVAEYPNGGKDVKIIIDTPYQPAKDVWNEYEDIQVYMLFSEEEQKQLESEQLKSKNERKLQELKQRLSQLSEDLIQSTAGEIIADIDSRKAEFVKLHNELRVLLGKDERKVE